MEGYDANRIAKNSENKKKNKIDKYFLEMTMIWWKITRQQTNLVFQMFFAFFIHISYFIIIYIFIFCFSSFLFILFVFLFYSSSFIISVSFFFFFFPFFNLCHFPTSFFLFGVHFNDVIVLNNVLWNACTLYKNERIQY